MGSVEEIRNVAVLGHKGAGKTSLVEAALYLAKATPRLGRNGDRASGLDDSPEEKAHAATLETRVATLRWRDKKITLLDTPGEASFQADSRLALAAADAAIVVVNGRAGVEIGTERALRWVRETRTPCVVVVSKMDDDNARPDEVIAEVREHLGKSLAVMELPQGKGHDFHGVIAVRTGKAYLGDHETPASARPLSAPPESRRELDAAHAHLVDDVAATDDVLTEHYLEGGDLTQGELDEGTRKAVLAGKLVPLYEVSSTGPSGVAALLDAIAELLPAPSARAAWRGREGGVEAERLAAADGPLAAFVFKTHVDPHAGRASWVRVLSGTLRADSSLVCAQTGQKERPAQLLQGTPREPKIVSEAVAGEIVAVTKLKSARTGDTLADEKRPFTAELPPRPVALFSRALLVEGHNGNGKAAEDKAAQAVLRLTEEDPGLVFAHEESGRSMLLSGLGPLHLDVTLERLRRKVGIDAKLGPPRVAYRETIRGAATKIEGKLKKQTGGHGQYAVCVLDLEPLPRGAGFAFEDAVVGGAVPRQFIPSVEKGVRRALERGKLAGYPVVDVKVRLVDGKSHSVDSSDAAFQAAAVRAFRAAVLASRPTLLEPIARLEISFPREAMGDVLGDLSSRHGKVLSTGDSGESVLVTALLPVAQTLDYEPQLTAITRGRGHFTMAFDHYDFCPKDVEDKVIRDSGMAAAADDED